MFLIFLHCDTTTEKTPTPVERQERERREFEQRQTQVGKSYIYTGTNIVNICLYEFSSKQQPVAKMLRHSDKKRVFLAANRC